MVAKVKRLTKRTVDAARPGMARYILWDGDLKGFGLRIETSGTKSYLVRYRPRGGGAKGPKRFVTIGRHGTLTPEQARGKAAALLLAVAGGADPVLDRQTNGGRPTVKALFEDFMRLHVEPKLKRKTAETYRSAFRNYVLPQWGSRTADALATGDLLRQHSRMTEHKITANRVLTAVSAMYGWASAKGFGPKGYNPTSGIERYTETKKERYLSAAELDRLGEAIREAETLGIPWEVDESQPNAKHTPKAERQTPISPGAAAALRLLLFTGARLREVLNLRWEWVDFERAALFLPDSKTGKKTIYLNGPALAVLNALPRTGSFVFAGEARAKSSGKKVEQPRHDLKRPWEGIRRMAGLEGVRLHDLRHTHASFGVGGGLGLPVIAKLLGHAQIRTTERYSHLDADPVRCASETIGKRIQEAMGEGANAKKNPVVLPSRRATRRT